MRFIAIILTTITFLSGADRSEFQHKPNLSELGWIAGYWSAEVNGTLTEEFWLPPSGSMMVGIHRDTFPSGKAFFEYLRIVETESGISYLASPGGKTPTEFKLKELTGQKVIFENPDHDFPQRIIYSLVSEDTLMAGIEGEVNGELKSQQWKWAKKD